ncbi:MAG: GTPase/DUF3482 domain-containing protein [Chthoniobacterales bacterium]
MEEMTIPYFACVGAVNTGKTSTIATLIEDDRLRITDTPGETTQCQSFVVELEGEPIVGFSDTPGFQNAKSALARLRELENPVGDPLEAFRKFLEHHGDDPAFSEECKLFRPLVDGAGVLYIVDSSQPFREINDAEMKILLMSARPRMGLINTTASPEHLGVWEARLGQHFNLVRRFDAHEADYFDRMELLKALMGIDEKWRGALERAVKTYERDWTGRREDCAEEMTELILESLQHRETAAVSLGSERDERNRSTELVKRFEDSLRRIESRAHRRIIEVFKHHAVSPGESAGALQDVDLFSEDVWRFAGLDANQLVVSAAVAGAVAGLAVDVALAGHSLGAASLLGGALGGGGAWLAGKQRPHIEVDLPGQLGQLFGRQKMAGRDLRVGPLKAINFPWILLDRSLAVFYYSARRSHARRGELEFRLDEQLTALSGRGLLTQEWPEDVRKELEKLFTLIRKGRAGLTESRRLREILKDRLERIGAKEIASGSASADVG